MKIKHFWGYQAFFLGVYEYAAIKTGKVPTITRLVRNAKKRNRLTHVFVAAWLIGLGKHLLKDEDV